MLFEMPQPGGREGGVMRTAFRPIPLYGCVVVIICRVLVSADPGAFSLIPGPRVPQGHKARGPQGVRLFRAPTIPRANAGKILYRRGR